jgi:hypothetical protein
VTADDVKKPMPDREATKRSVGARDTRRERARHHGFRVGLRAATSQAWPPSSITGDGTPIIPLRWRFARLQQR